jgi:hypothetical protein
MMASAGNAVMIMRWRDLDRMKMEALMVRELSSRSKYTDIEWKTDPTDGRFSY